MANTKKLVDEVPEVLKYVKLNDEHFVKSEGIYKAIQEMLYNIGLIPKSGWNEKQEFAFRKIDTIIDRMHWLCKNANVVVLPNVLSSKVTVIEKSSGKQSMLQEIIMSYKLVYTPDGSFVEVGGPGTGLDHGGDKCSGKAKSDAYKYVLSQMFNIPTQEEDDAMPSDVEEPAITQKETSNVFKPISKEQVAEIELLMKTLKLDQNLIFRKMNSETNYKRFLQGRIVTKVSEIPLQLGEETIRRLQDIKKGSN